MQSNKELNIYIYTLSNMFAKEKFKKTVYILT